MLLFISVQASVPTVNNLVKLGGNVMYAIDKCVVVSNALGGCSTVPVKSPVSLFSPE